MKTPDAIYRFLWCDKENRPTVHAVTYVSSRVAHNEMRVCFCHVCLACNTDENKIVIKYSEVPLADWQALKTRIIYDHV